MTDTDVCWRCGGLYRQRDLAERLCPHCAAQKPLPTPLRRYRRARVRRARLLYEVMLSFCTLFILIVGFRTENTAAVFIALVCIGISLTAWRWR